MCESLFIELLSLPVPERVERSLVIVYAEKKSNWRLRARLPFPSQKKKKRTTTKRYKNKINTINNSSFVSQCINYCNFKQICK